jgi:hypothetical protein
MVTKFNRQLTWKICKKIEVGVPFNHAAIASGITESTFWLYMNRHSEFKEAVNKAKSKGLTKLIGEIRLDKSLQAKMWLAERWDRENFNLATISDKQFAEAIEKLNKRLDERIIEKEVEVVGPETSTRSIN